MTTEIMLHELITRSACASLSLQGQDGAMPPGQNGPWNDLETPVRNTGYWLITFLKVYEVTGDQRYLLSAHRAADYLASDVARPAGAAFWHRNNPRKDGSNGLIGQAWTLEALAVACLQLERPELGKIAEEVFLQHSFDDSKSLWLTLNVDGNPGNLMRTFNQQIWFAAAGALIAKLPFVSKVVDERVNRFVHHFHKYLRYDSHGIIKHVFDVRFSPLHRLIGYWRRRTHSTGWQARLDILSIGYHTFNLYGFALLKQAYPDSPFWISRRFPPMWKPIDSQEFPRLAVDNPYAYLYNPSGIEIAFALQVFRPQAQEQIKLNLAEQISRCFDFETGYMEAGGTKDPLTLAARLYEAIRLPNYTVEI
jgi:hypothetical protein